MIDDPHIDDGDDRLASELVLGLLSAGDREAAEARALADPGFAERVAFWQAQLSPLDDHYSAVRPPAGLKARIEARLFGQPARVGLWSSLWLWRGLAAAGVAAALAMALVPASAPPDLLTASLANDGTELQLVAVYDRATALLKLNHVSGSPDPDRDFELWVIAGDNPPASLGLVSAGGRSEFLVPATLRPHFSGAYALAISNEPAGGSPSGAPTGNVLAVGQAVEI